MMRVLIVDDSRAVQAILHRKIQELGYPEIEFQKADNGETALNIIREWEPDLVISDWHMPKMNGIELLAAVEREMLDIDLGFVTAETSEERLAEAKTNGARFVIQKPFDKGTLEQALQPILQSHYQPESDIEPRAEIKADQNQVNDTDNSNPKKHIILPQINTLQTQLNKLTKTRITLTKAPSLIMEKKHFPYLIGLYGNKDKPSVHAVAIADIRTIGILGRLTQEVSQGHIQQTLITRQVSQKVLDQGRKVLTFIESTLYNMQNEESLILRNAKLLKSPADHIKKLLDHNQKHRLDMWINIAGYHPGCLTIIVS